MPAFVIGGKPIAGHAWAKRHCSYYPHSGAVLTELADELVGYDWSKGTLRFPVDQPLAPELVARLVEVELRQLAGAGRDRRSRPLIRTGRGNANKVLSQARLGPEQLLTTGDGYHPYPDDIGPPRFQTPGTTAEPGGGSSSGTSA